MSTGSNNLVDHYPAFPGHWEGDLIAGSKNSYYCQAGSRRIHCYIGKYLMQTVCEVIGILAEMGFPSIVNSQPPNRL